MTYSKSSNTERMTYSKKEEEEWRAAAGRDEVERGCDSMMMRVTQTIFKRKREEEKERRRRRKREMEGEQTEATMRLM